MIRDRDNGKRDKNEAQASGREADLPIEIRAEDEAWFVSQVELVNRLAADEEPVDAPVAPEGAPIVFLDLDDVLCLCDPVGGLDALDCVTAKRPLVEFVYRRLFHAPAVAVLQRVHEHIGGRLRYVISSTWAEFLTRAQLRHVMRQAGLGFVADCVEDRARWATPRGPRPDRYGEIKGWLEAHHTGEPFLVVDDQWSGSLLAKARAFRLRVVLCRENVGLEAHHVEKMLRALKTPKGEFESW